MNVFHDSFAVHPKEVGDKILRGIAHLNTGRTLFIIEPL
jgi:hypothetical protein